MVALVSPPWSEGVEGLDSGCCGPTCEDLSKQIITHVNLHHTCSFASLLLAGGVRPWPRGPTARRGVRPAYPVRSTPRGIPRGAYPTAGAYLVGRTPPARQRAPRTAPAGYAPRGVPPGAYPTGAGRTPRSVPRGAYPAGRTPRGVPGRRGAGRPAPCRQGTPRGIRPAGYALWGTPRGVRPVGYTPRGMRGVPHTAPWTYPPTPQPTDTPCGVRPRGTRGVPRAAPWAYPHIRVPHRVYLALVIIRFSSVFRKIKFSLKYNISLHVICDDGPHCRMNYYWKLDLPAKDIDRSILTLQEIKLRKTVGFRRTQTQGMKSRCATVAPILYIN